MPLGDGVPVKRGRQIKVSPVILPLLARLVWKRLQIGTDMLFVITSTDNRLFGFINMDDLKHLKEEF